MLRKYCPPGQRKWAIGPYKLSYLCKGISNMICLSQKSRLCDAYLRGCCRFFAQWLFLRSYQFWINKDNEGGVNEPLFIFLSKAQDFKLRQSRISNYNVLNKKTMKLWFDMAATTNFIFSLIHKKRHNFSNLSKWSK